MVKKSSISKNENTRNSCIPTIDSSEDLWANCEIIDKYLKSKKDPEYSYALELIKRGTCFIAIEKNGAYKFYPSRFVGYQENSMIKHENNDLKDGRETNLAICVLLKKSPMPNADLDEIYKEYCRALGFEPQDKGAFGVEHKFWSVKSVADQKKIK